VTEFTPDLCGRVITDSIVSVWRDQVGAGHLTREGLRAVRSHLDPQLPHGFTSPEADLCRVEVHSALAAAAGIEPDELPCLWPELQVAEEEFFPPGDHQ
jgi:hypothetical protein